MKIGSYKNGNRPISPQHNKRGPGLSARDTYRGVAVRNSITVEVDPHHPGVEAGRADDHNPMHGWGKSLQPKKEFHWTSAKDWAGLIVFGPRKFLEHIDSDNFRGAAKIATVGLLAATFFAQPLYQFFFTHGLGFSHKGVLGGFAWFAGLLWLTLNALTARRSTQVEQSIIVAPENKTIPLRALPDRETEIEAEFYGGTQKKLAENPAAAFFAAIFTNVFVWSVLTRSPGFGETVHHFINTTNPMKPIWIGFVIAYGHAITMEALRLLKITGLAIVDQWKGQGYMESWRKHWKSHLIDHPPTIWPGSWVHARKHFWSGVAWVAGWFYVFGGLTLHAMNLATLPLISKIEKFSFNVDHLLTSGFYFLLLYGLLLGPLIRGVASGWRKSLKEGNLSLFKLRLGEAWGDLLPMRIKSALFRSPKTLQGNASDKSQTYAAVSLHVLMYILTCALFKYSTVTAPWIQWAINRLGWGPSILVLLAIGLLPILSSMRLLRRIRNLPVINRGKAPVPYDNPRTGAFGNFDKRNVYEWLAIAGGKYPKVTVTAGALSLIGIMRFVYELAPIPGPWAALAHASNGTKFGLLTFFTGCFISYAVAMGVGLWNRIHRVRGNEVLSPEQQARLVDDEEAVQDARNRKIQSVLRDGRQAMAREIRRTLDH